MYKILSTFFKIHKGEELIICKFVLLFMLLQAGLSIGITTSDSLFLLNIGVNKLPVIYVLMPLLMIGYISIYSFVTSKIAHNKVFEYVIIILFFGGLVIYALLTLFRGTLIFNYLLYFVKFYSSLWFIAIYSIVWSYTYKYFDIQDGKRLFAFFTGGSAIGAILGGFLINILTNFIDVTNLFVVWSFISLLTYPVLKWILQTEKTIDIINIEEVEDVSFKDQIFSTASVISQSKYVRIVLCVLIVAQVLTNICEFQYMDIFSKNSSEKELANLFAKLFITINCFNFIISLFVFNRLALRLGVRNIALMQPVIYSFAFTYLFIKYDYYAALFGFFAYQGFMVAIDYDNTNLLFNALPAESQENTRVFVEGLAEPLATALAGGFLLFFGTSMKASSISLVGLCLALLYLILVMILRNEYMAAMITNLKKSWLDFSKNPNEVISKLNNDEIKYLEKIGADGNGNESYIALKILWLHDKKVTITTFFQFSERTSYKQRLSLIPVFSQMIKESDTDLFRLIMEWIEKNNNIENIGYEFIEEILANDIPQPKFYNLAYSPDPNQIALGAIALWNSWEPEKRSEATKIIETLLKKNDDFLNASIVAIGRTKVELYAHYIAQYLKNSNPKIRKSSIKSICQLVNVNSKRIIPHILEMIQKEDSYDRMMGMDALIKIANSVCIPPLMDIAHYFTPIERRKAEQVILSIGLKGVPMAVYIIKSKNCTHKGKSIAARALSRMAFPQFELLSASIIVPELKDAYRYLYYYSVLNQEESTPGLEVLKKFYLDIQRTIVEYVLELLTLGGKLPDYELVSASLRSKSTKERGNAIETIEQGVPRDIFNLILPLIDSRTTEQIVTFFTKHYTIHTMTSEEIVIESINSNNPLECTTGAQILSDKDFTKYQGIIRNKMRETRSTLFKKTALVLLGINKTTERFNFKDRIFHLLNSSLFKSFGVQALELIARNLVEKDFPSGDYIYKAGEKANHLYCITSGEAKSTDNTSYYKGDVFGKDCLLNKHYLTDMISENMSALIVPKETLIKNAEIYPKTALIMYEFFRKSIYE
jgi:hypothetical protein